MPTWWEHKARVGGWMMSCPIDEIRLSITSVVFRFTNPSYLS
jgi:hypothetical protein